MYERTLPIVTTLSIIRKIKTTHPAKAPNKKFNNITIFWAEDSLLNTKENKYVNDTIAGPYNK